MEPSTSGTAALIQLGHNGSSKNEKKTAKRAMKKLKWVPWRKNTKKLIDMRTGTRLNDSDDNYVRTKRLLKKRVFPLFVVQRFINRKVRKDRCHSNLPRDATAGAVDAANRFKEREERLLQLQQQRLLIADLLDHDDSVNNKEQETDGNQLPHRPLPGCPICLEPFSNKEISSTICGHVFCTSCIVSAIKSQKSCPNCRKSLTLKKIHPLFM